MSSNEIRLKPKDGKTHVFFIKILENITFKDNLSEIASNEVDRIITAVQDRGYEIVDIKFTSSHSNLIRVMVMYQ